MLGMNNNSKNGANTTTVSTTSNGNNGGAGATKAPAGSGTEAEGGGQTNPAGPSAQANAGSVGTTAAAAILQNHGLRKSMQGSTAGLRSLQTTMTTSNQGQIQQQQQQQQQQQLQHQLSNPAQRQSHSHSSHTHAHQPTALGAGAQMGLHGQGNPLGHAQHQQNYHSVTAQGRASQQQAMGIYLQPNQKINGGAGNPVGSNYGANNMPGQNVAVSTAGGGPGVVGASGAIKYQNTVANGAGAHAGIGNHKQFSMSTQQGLFPKITNLRIDNQSVPNSAHSHGHGANGSAGSGQITSAAAMNVLKHSGGHISGMSNHPTHHNLNHPNERHHYRGLGGGTAMNPPGSQGSHHMGMNMAIKPLSSPRTSQQHQIPMGADGSSIPNQGAIQNDPNYIYQQQLQWKTKPSIQPGAEGQEGTTAPGNAPTAGADPQNPAQQQQLFSSPGPVATGAAAAQIMFDQQRAKQISSGSEKRLKLHQQRQYYSEQYRVQQQRQHQQTANAVLSQNGAGAPGSQPSPNTLANGEPGRMGADFTPGGTSANYRMGMSMPSRDPGGAALRSAEYSGGQGNRTGKIHSSQQQSQAQAQAMTPQMYSQQRQRQHIGALPQSTMHNTQMINTQGPVSASMMAPPTHGAVALSQQHQKQHMPQVPNGGAAQYQQNNGQVFFKKRASSNTNSQHQGALSSPSKDATQIQTQPLQPVPQPQGSTSPVQISQQIISSNPVPPREPGAAPQSPKASSQTQYTNLSQQSGAITSTQAASTTQSLQASQQTAGQQSSTTQSTTANQQQQPKIPVICGFHKRILLITCQGANNQGGAGPGQPPNGQNGGPQGLAGLNPNSSMSQARRIRNKNPNCNHNSNSVFYQPHYNNVKYDDQHKKKEDVLRKVFFKECAKEEEKRLYNGSAMFPNGQFPGQGAPGPNGHMYAGSSEMARQQAFSQANDPNKHLQIIERILCEYLFVSQPFDRSQKQQLSNTQSLMMELGLDRALTPHRAFLLALIRAGKFNADNMLKVLSEVKTSATEFDNECIYCKYSQYALKESAKLLQKHQAALAEQSQTNPQQALAQQQQIQANGGIIKGPSGEDIRIENLVRMFQSQLFKKSFINTSLMIIQRKMTEKYFQKYHNAKQAQQAQANGQDAARANAQAGVQYGPDGKPIEPVKRPAKKTKPKNTINMNSLEYLSKEIQKLGKNLANPKDKERFLELKEKYYREFLMKVLKSNGIDNPKFPNASFAPYKYYIGRGNNSGIVRTALKSRFWWSMGDFDDWEDYNFIWTQWKSNKILACVKSWKEHQDQIQKDEDKKRSSQSTRADNSQLSTQATDKESTSSKENLITTPKKNKLASSTLGNTNSELQFKKQQSATAQNSATKNSRILARGGKKGDKEEDEKEENVTSHSQISYGKMENNYHLSNKKAIYYNMKVYYEAIGKDYYQNLPLTFHIKEGLNDPQFTKFEQLFMDAQEPGKETILDQIPKFGKGLWIVKPGENTNRGCGIQVSKDLDHIKGLVQNTIINGNKRSYIIQKYIEKPLLYKNRKFDIRCFTMMCSIGGNLQGYWYAEGYFRTSCREFTLKNVSNRYVHLTNDAVQKKLDDYGKFESGNKLSYAEFQKYLDTNNYKVDLVKEVVPKMKQMAQDSMRAVSRKLDSSRKSYSYEIFGYDFMIDEDFNVWLIEVNTNPCLELSSPYLARLIPAMVENSLKIAVDPVFPPPPVPVSKRHSIPDAQDNKFELIFNEREDAAELKNLPIDDNMNGIIEEEEMEEEGSDIEEEEVEQE